jgi:hypothetical protein
MSVVDDASHMSNDVIKYINKTFGSKYINDIG